MDNDDIHECAPVTNCPTCAGFGHADCATCGGTGKVIQASPATVAQEDVPLIVAFGALVAACNNLDAESEEYDLPEGWGCGAQMEHWSEFRNALEQANEVQLGAAIVKSWDRFEAALATAQPAPQEAQPVDDLEQAQMVCAEAYQVVGSMLDDLGQFNTERATKVLDNLSQHRMVHDDVLPWPSFAAPQPARAGVGELSDRELVDLAERHGAQQCGLTGDFLGFPSVEAIRSFAIAAMSATAGEKGA